MPAVVILDEVQAVIGQSCPGSEIAAIDHCKFQDFVLPDQPFEISLTSSADGRVDFTCRAIDDGRALASGRLRLMVKNSEGAKGST